jgi:DNA/RNA-binding domain of Phe-tRNA-synthetase-like protein
VGEGAIRSGWVAPELAQELPGLEVFWLTVDAAPARTPEPIRRRMRDLADRITGAKVVQSRRDSVPWSYRVLWRRLGVDPDVDRTPVEALMVQRLEYGGLPSRGMPNDAIVDAARVSGRPGLRPAATGEAIGADRPLRGGEVIYADERAPLARLDGEVATDVAVGDGTTSMLVCALAASAVSRLEIDEALWTAARMLEAIGRVEGSNPGRTQ